MPLTRPVTFKATLQEGNRIQIPRLIRWQYKLEPQQILKASVAVSCRFSWEQFHTHMTKDGRIVVPKLILQLLQNANESLVGQILEIQLEPIEDQ